jgi:putative ABC transport system permease protein
MAGLVDMTTLDQSSILPDWINGWPIDSAAFDELKIVAGHRPRDNRAREVLLGALLAQRLGKRVGDTVEVEVEPFEVVGIFESRNHYENGGLVMPLGALQELIDREGMVTAFSLRMAPAADRAAAAARICAEIEQLAGADGEPLGLEASTSDEFIATTSELHFAKGIAWMTSTVALLISAVGVLNTMMMSVFERTGELGVLRAIGWSRARIVRLVLYESIGLSLLGAVCGSAAALLVVRILSRMPAAASIVEGSVPPLVVGQGLLLGVLIGSLGGLYPALRAATLAPANAIRHI